MNTLFHVGGTVDAAGLAALHGACFEEAWTADAFSRLLAQPGVFALRAEAATQVQAMALFRAAADEAEILTLATRASARRQGLARALVEQGAADAWRRGARTLFLEVAEDNEAARTLYERLGLRLAGRRKHYYVRPRGMRVDALVLRAGLPF